MPKKPRFAGVATSTSITPSRISKSWSVAASAVEMKALAPLILGDSGLLLRASSAGSPGERKSSAASGSGRRRPRAEPRGSDRGVGPRRICAWAENDYGAARRRFGGVTAPTGRAMDFGRLLGNLLAFRQWIPQPGQRHGRHPGRANHRLVQERSRRVLRPGDMPWPDDPRALSPDEDDHGFAPLRAVLLQRRRKDLGVQMDHRPGEGQGRAAPDRALVARLRSHRICPRWLSSSSRTWNHLK